MPPDPPSVHVLIVPPPSHFAPPLDQFLNEGLSRHVEASQSLYSNQLRSEKPLQCQNIHKKHIVKIP